MSSNNFFVTRYAHLHWARDVIKHLQDAGFATHKLFMVTPARDAPAQCEGARCVSALSELGASLYNCIPERR